VRFKHCPIASGRSVFALVPTEIDGGTLQTLSFRKCQICVCVSANWSSRRCASNTVTCRNGAVPKGIKQRRKEVRRNELCLILQRNILVSIVQLEYTSAFVCSMYNIINNPDFYAQHNSRSQWPRGLRRRSAAARLLRLRFRIPPWAWMPVCCECCVLSGRGLCDGLITRPEESYRMWCVVVCDL